MQVKFSIIDSYVPNHTYIWTELFYYVFRRDANAPKKKNWHETLTKLLEIVVLNSDRSIH
jgi:hypothetical protein